MIRGMDVIETRKRRRVVVDHRELARAIGGRIRAARVAAGLTQQELAGDRYTKAYVSALELGHAKPSMAALDYLAPRLGTTSDRLIADHATRWSRLDADLHLASGRLAEAAEAYEDLAELATDRVSRGELLLGAAEAHCKLHQAQAASPLLIEAIRLLATGGRPADQQRAQYWLAYVHMALDDPDEARRLLQAMLGTDPSLVEDPDFEVRVRIALAQLETEHGDPARGALYLEEARDLTGSLDLRKRGIYFDALSKARFEANDTEGAIRAATEALALFRASEQEVQEAQLENALAMSFVRLGNLGPGRRARGAGRRDRRAAQPLPDPRPLPRHPGDDPAGPRRRRRGDPADRSGAGPRGRARARERAGRRPDHARAGADGGGPARRGRRGLGRCGGGRARPVLAAPASPDPRGVGRVAGRAGSPRRGLRGHARGHLTAQRRHSTVREPVPKPAPPDAGG